jgi:hypothetical protein
MDNWQRKTTLDGLPIVFEYENNEQSRRYINGHKKPWIALEG